METPAGTMARAAEGLAASLALIDELGAEGLRPWWWLARVRLGPAGEAAHSHEQALRAFGNIGAHALVERYRAPSAAMRAG